MLLRLYTQSRPARRPVGCPWTFFTLCSPPPNPQVICSLATEHQLLPTLPQSIPPLNPTDHPPVLPSLCYVPAPTSADTPCSTTGHTPARRPGGCPQTIFSSHVPLASEKKEAWLSSQLLRRKKPGSKTSTQKRQIRKLARRPKITPNSDT